MSQPSSQASTDHAGQQDALPPPPFKPVWLRSSPPPPHPGCLHHLRPLRNPHRDCREQKTAGAGNTGCGYWGTRCPRLIPASVKLTSEEPNWCHAGPAQPPFSTPKWRGDGFQIPRKGSGTCGEAPEVTALPGQGERHPAPWPCIRPPPPPSRFFPVTSRRKARIGFRSRSLGYKYHPPTHTSFPSPQPGPGRTLAQRQLSLPVRAP